MQKVHAAESILLIAHLRNVLESAGIRCLLRNERLGSVLGEIPFLECWPELWVERDGDAARARQLIREHLQPPAHRGPDWTCPACGERLEAQFAECWRCADLSPEVE